MMINRTFGMVLGLVVGASPLAFADNVIVGSQPATPVAAQPAPVVVQPAQPAAAPTVVQPVVEEPSKRSVVRTDVSQPHSYMGTIAGSAFLGAVAGVLIGGAIYYLGNQDHPANILYWGAGGVLVGTGVGVMQIMVQESRVSQATAMSRDPAPTLRLALYQTRF